MKKSIYIFLLLFSVVGCEKVIDVDLNDANPAIVIEGNLSRFPIVAEVKLSKTGSYFGDSFVEKISGASVIVENDLGELYRFEEIKEGIYKSNEIVPEHEMLYKLIVESEGEIYEASSTLHQTVRIDSLNYFYDEGFAFMDEGYIVKIYFVDPPQKSNYYRIKIFENDTLKNEPEDLIIFDDRLIDGQSLEITLRGVIFEQNDSVSVQLISLDKSAFEYYDTFQELININPGSAAPANPTSNISNGALGYFSVWSSDERTIVIEE